jgi:short-subunit dehydrogenase
MNDSKQKGVAIVTGATAGIGMATAVALRDAGYTVFGTSRKPKGESQSGITMLTCDLTNDDSVAGLLAEVVRRAGRIDVLVNNAGFGLIAGAEESSVEQAKSVFEVNVFAVMRITNQVLPTMRAQGSGRIINIGSVLGFVPSPYYSTYSATKHAIEGYSQALDHEVRTFGIRVICVEPAVTRTSFESNMLAPDRPLAIYESTRVSMIEAGRKQMETGDEPEVVARVVLSAVQAAKPRLHYPAGPAAQRLTLLRRFVPESLFDSSLRKQFKLPA